MKNTKQNQSPQSAPFTGYNVDGFTGKVTGSFTFGPGGDPSWRTPEAPGAADPCPTCGKKWWSPAQASFCCPPA